MARINTYERDTDVSGLDLLVGSEFYLDSGVPKYRTKNYSVNDLSTFFGLNAGNINSRLSTYLGVLNEDGSFTYSTAFANQSLSVIATAGYASASFVTNLGAIVGTLNANGTLSQLSQAFADQVLNVTSSTKFASTSFATNLASSFGTYNADGSIAVLSSSFADNVLSTMNTSSLASASYVTNLSSSLGTFNADGTLASLSSSFADNVFSTMNTSTLASAASVTTLNAELILKPSITRAATAPSIQQEVQNVSGAVTTPQSPPNGSMWIDISTTTVTAADGSTSQQPKNEMYVLAGSAGSVAWTLTKDATLLNTITSLATAEQSLTTVSNAQGATATFATNLAANFGSVQANGNGLDLSAGFADQILSTEASSGSSISQLNTALGASVTLKPNIFRQNAAPTSLAIGDIWFDTDDKNKMYVAQGIGNDEVSASEWILTADERLADTISSLATTDQNLTAESNARGALATFTTGLASSFGSADSTTGALTGYSAGFVDSVMGTNNSAGSSISGINNALESLVVAKPDVFRQTEPPTVTAASGGTPQSPAPGSIWYDTNDNMVPYVLVATTWTKTTDERINDTKVGYLATATENISTISTRSSSTSTKFTNLAADYGSFSGDTFSPGLSAAAGAAITATVTAAGAFTTAVNTINASLNKVITGSSTPSVTDVTIPTGSIWVNTSNGKSYVLTAGSPKTWVYTENPDFATVTELSTAVAGVDGKLNASYGLTVGAGNAIAGMKLLSDGTSSTVSFSSDQFNIYTAGGNVRPFTVSGNVVTMSNVVITGALNGATGTFNGNLSGASGTFTGGLSGATISGGTITIGNHTENVFKASASGIQLGNTDFNSAEFSVTPAGVLKAISGTIGGWTLGSTTFTSANDKVTLSSADSNLPNIEDSISGQPSGTYNGSTTAYNHFYSTSNGGVSVANNYVGLSSGSTVSETSNRNTADGWGGGYPFSSISFVANSSSAGKPVTITVNVSNSTSHAYLSKIVTTGSTNSYSFSGSYQVKIVMGIYKANSGTIASTTRVFGGTSPEEDSSGNLLIGLPDNYLMSVNLSSTTLVSGHTYYIRAGIQWVYIQGTFGTTSITGYRVYFATPRSSGGAIIYAVGRTEVIGGGLQVIKGSDAFLSLNRSQNTATNPFMLSRGYSKHQGDLYVDGALDAASKNFKIKHPLSSKSSTHYLIHSSIESPRADLIYRGKVKIFNEVTVVNIDEESNMTSGTFEVLCRNVQCFTTNETSWGAIKARVEGNLLIITAKEVGSFDTISWMVVGERCDADIYMSNNTDVNGKLIVELEK